MVGEVTFVVDTRQSQGLLLVGLTIGYSLCWLVVIDYGYWTTASGLTVVL